MEHTARPVQLEGVILQVAFLNWEMGIPGQVVPPPRGVGLVHERILCCSCKPLGPQLTEHELPLAYDQEDQAEIPPSTTMQIISH